MVLFLVVTTGMSALASRRKGSGMLLNILSTRNYTSFLPFKKKLSY